MKQYGLFKTKRQVPSSFANNDNGKKLITDYFSINIEKSSNNSFSDVCSIPREVAETKKKQQTYLDLGQTNLLFKECPECGLRYDPSFDSEMKLHARYHRFHVTGVVVKYRQQDVLARYSSYTAIIVPDSRKEAIFEFVNDEMNAVDVVGNEQAYAIVDSANRICSVLVSEPHTELLLVSRIWTRKDVRRRGMASILLKSVLDFEGKLKENIHFSSPTPSGTQFGIAFMGGEENFNLYNNK